MPTTERMASADTAWLHMDRPTNLMVVNCVFWFEQPLDREALAAAFRERVLPSFPRFRQRAVEPPVTVGALTPRWEDVDDHDVLDHLTEVRLPAPGSDAQLHAYVSTQAVVPLDRSRPLWQVHLVQGYGQGCAILLRTHHAIADGTALVQALLSLVDAPEAGRHGDQLPIGRRQAELDVRAALGREADRTRRLSAVLLGGLTATIRRPLEAVRKAVERGAMLGKLGFGSSDDDSSLRGPLSGRKRLTWSTSVPVEDVKRLGKAHSATVNDVALAAVAGALRRYLGTHGQTAQLLTAVVPVNLRPLDQPLDPGQGNEFGLAFVRLPVGEPDPLARLKAVKAEMDEVKATGEGVVVYGALATMGHTPVQVEQAMLDLFGSRATAVVTNIAGPREPVRLAGVPLAGFTGWVPSTGPIGVGLSVCSYAGELLLGVSVDEALVPDSDALLEALAEEVRALLALTG